MFKAQFPSEEEFNFKYGKIKDVDVVLITPTFNPIFNESNKWFRSSMWTVNERTPVSLGYRKFVDFDKQPEFEPLNLRENLDYLEKKDGSLGILSYFKGELIFRTRGTFSARSLNNGYEVDYLVNKYPKLFNSKLIKSEEVSILTEWCSPNNQDFLVFPEKNEPKLWLTSIVNHKDYTYFPQYLVDELAEEWEVPRPQRYSFKNLDEAINQIKGFQDKEGIVVYGNNGNCLKRVKSLRYLVLHKMISDFASFERRIDLYAELNFPNYQVLITYLEKTFDSHLAGQLKGTASKICDGMKEVEKIVEHMQKFVLPLKQLPRKDAALKIQSSYGKETGRTGMLFQLLDGKQIEIKDKKKLLYQVLKD